MANFDEHIDLIERFFAGTLSEEEKQLVQEKLETDRDFLAAFNMEKDIVEGIQASGDIALRKRMDRIHEKKIDLKPANNKGAKRVLFVRRIRMLAAVILLAIVAGFAFWQINRPPFGERAFMAYYETPDFDDLSRGTDDLSDPLFKSAKDKFDANNFSGSLEDLNQLLAKNANFIPAILMKGISLMETGQFEEAAVFLSSIPDSSDQYDKATWYLGLNFLKQNKLEEAKAEFKKLADGTVRTAPRRKALAQEILDQLN